MPEMMSFVKNALDSSIGLFAVTTTPKAYCQEIKMLRLFTNVRIGLGLHPQLVADRYGELSLVEKYIQNTEYIGEIGLDFSKHFYASKEKQLIVFSNIINWCSFNPGKIISIHSVHVDKATLDILEKNACYERNKCILHWFSGSLSQLQRAVEMGCYFSINGAMVRSPNGRKLLANIPPENLLIESDAPFVGAVKTITNLKTEFETVFGVLRTLFGCEIENKILATSLSLLKL
jgi:TatD DNase family protein